MEFKGKNWEHEREKKREKERKRERASQVTNSTTQHQRFLVYQVFKLQNRFTSYVPSVQEVSTLQKVKLAAYR